MKYDSDLLKNAVKLLVDASNNIFELDGYVTAVIDALAHYPSKVALIDLVPDDQAFFRETRGDAPGANDAQRRLAIDLLNRRALRSDQQLLLSGAILNLWTIIESVATDFHLALVEDDFFFRILVSEIKEKVELSLLLRDQQSQREVAVRLLEKQLSLDHKIGTTGFDRVWETYKICPTASDLVKRRMISLKAIRNVIAHRNGVVDQRCKDLAPWLPYEVGKELQLTNEDFQAYSWASFAYIYCVELAVLETYPVSGMDRNRDFLPVLDDLISDSREGGTSMSMWKFRREAIPDQHVE